MVVYNTYIGVHVVSYIMYHPRSVYRIMYTPAYTRGLYRAFKLTVMCCICVVSDLLENKPYRKGVQHDTVLRKS